MKITDRALALGALPSLLLLGGCLGSLVGGGKPDALYRFGSFADVPVQAEAGTPRRMLLLPAVRFPAAASGDRILTISGDQIAYVKDVRWMSASSILYHDSLTEALRRRAPDIAITDPSTVSRAQAVLSVEIERFEASYDDGVDRPPVIYVAGAASLIDPANRSVLARRSFAHSVRSSANTTGAIVRGIDLASRQGIVELADWAARTVPTTRRDNAKAAPWQRTDPRTEGTRSTVSDGKTLVS